MPDVEVFIEAARAHPVVVSGLVMTIKARVSGNVPDAGEGDYRFPEDKVWVHIVGTLNPGHVTVKWSAHTTDAERDVAWVTRVSQALAEDIYADLVHAYGFPSETEVCVDGEPRDRASKTGFASEPRSSH